MKKIMAVLLCTVMLLTVAAVMPAAADGESTEATVNLITNGDFEADAAGEDSVAAEAANVTEITGWTQLLETNKAILVAREGGSNWVKGFNDSNGAYDGTDLPDGAGISQTVTIDTEADWYTDYRNYKYVLTYDAHKAGSIWRGSVIVTVTGANGRVETTDVTPPAADYLPNAYHAGITVDLSTAVEKIGRSAVASIKLDLTAAGRYEYQTYDNIKLTPVYSPVVEAESFIPDGSFEELATAETPAWGFAGGASVDNLMTDEYAFDESYYVAVDAGQRVEQQLSGDVIMAGNAYMLELYYMSVEATAFLTVETNVGYLKLGEPTLPATGTTWDDAVWEKYQFMIVMRECDTEGVTIRLRNGATAANSVFYDYVTLTHVPGYDTENMLANADFEYGDDTYLPNWIQNGSMPMAKGSGFVVTGQFCAQSTGSYGALQQYVYVDPAYENSDLELSFYFNYSSGGGGMPAILVRAYREDGSFTGYTYTACVDMNSDGVLDAESGDRGCTADNQAYVDGQHWTIGSERTNTFYGTINLEKALSRDTDPRPVKRILIQLGTANLGGTYDSVKLSPKVSKIRFENSDLTVPESVSEIKNGELTMKAKYIGESESAKAYVAVYTVEEDGTYILEAVNMVTLGTDETEKTAAVTGLEIDENTVIKAFIWDGALTPILSKNLE